MIDVNKVILVGRLGADPVRRTTKTGLSVTNFSIATSYRRMQKDAVMEDGEIPMVDQTQWHRVVAWGKLGEYCARTLKKGSPVYVEGTFRSHTYNKDGIERMSFEVHSETISMIDREKREEPAALAS